MSAANSDYFTHVGDPGTATTLSSPGHTIGGTTFNVGSTANWSTDTGIIFAVDTVTIVNGEEVRDVGSYTEWEGVVASSTQISSATLRYGTDQNYPAGSTTRVYIPVASSRENRLVDGILEEHKQSGAHGDVTADSLTVSGASSFSGATTITGALTLKSFDGWISASNTWTYVSSTSFKVTGSDVTAKFPVGTKIKLTQTTDKYFYVTSTSFSTDTTVNVLGGSDYTLANATITSPFYSYDATPQGFPQTFNYAGPLTNSSSGAMTIGNGSHGYSFSMRGKHISVKGYFNVGSTTNMGSGGGGLLVPLPVTASGSGYNGAVPIGAGYADDTGTATYQMLAVYQNTTNASFFVANGVSDNRIIGATTSAPFTPGTGDSYKWSFEYDV